MAIQLCPVDTANVHPRNILGSSSSFDRERLSPFGSLSSRCWEAPAGGHGDLSPSSVQKQHGEHPARKMWLRRAVLAEVGDGAAYVPFIGSGDIPLACYPERTIYGIDLDPARVADARAALAFASVIVGDCDEGWPFPGVDDTSCYATLMPTPTPTARFEPSGSTLARRTPWGFWARMVRCSSMASMRTFATQTVVLSTMCSRRTGAGHERRIGCA